MYCWCFRKNIKKRLPYRALNKLSAMPSFPAAYQKFHFKQVRKEADAGCRMLSEPAPSTLKRQDIEDYSTEEHYDTYVSTFPTLMTTMAAVVSKNRFDDDAVEMPTSTTRHGPRGGKVDQRTTCVSTASRLLHQRHPKQIRKLATLNSLRNAVNLVPGKEQLRSSRLGDSFGKQESRKILEAASEGFDRPVLELKAKTESLYTGSMSSAAPRFRKAKAAQAKISHYVHGLDNVGRVSL